MNSLLHRGITALGAVVIALTLAACSSGGGGTALPAGLTQRMDQPGANLDRTQALAIINDYRRATGAAPLRADPSLDAAAQALAAQYRDTGNPPRQAQGTVLRTSAGYSTFAETFSGWRNSPADAAALADKTMSRAGIASTYSANSTYGVYWILVLAN